MIVAKSSCASKYGTILPIISQRTFLESRVEEEALIYNMFKSLLSFTHWLRGAYQIHNIQPSKR